MSGPKWISVIIVLLFVLCCCTVLAGVVVGGYSFFRMDASAGIPTPRVKDFPTRSPGGVPTRMASVPTSQAGTVPNPQGGLIPTPAMGGTGSSNPASPAAYDTKKILEEAVVPNNDLRELASRLKGITNIPETVPDTEAPRKVGDSHSFWVVNMDTNKNFKVKATLKYETAHSYFWVEDGVSFSQKDLERLADAFESKIYPTDREFFGSEWSPGIDNDVHLYVVFARGLGNSIAGYFSSVDEVNPLAHEYSNAHEAFMMNADNVRIEEDFTYGVLAHEFQHMIHWYKDRNEETWLNEGFSELAAFLNGYSEGGFDNVFVADPNLQLNDWPNDPNATTPHYGAAFLFVTYFLERFGEQATQALVADKYNGIDSVDRVLASLGINDGLTGKPVKADEVFGDWAVTNYLHDGSVGDGRFAYRRYTSAPKAFDTKEISDCPRRAEGREVKQYGTEYIKISCKGDYTLQFEGVVETGVLPTEAHSGLYAFWSNKGDESDMTLTREFDFTSTNGAITLSYWTWFDLEKDYDFAYLEASENGQTWEMIKTPKCTTDNISGNSYGCGYNNKTMEWVQEKVDLSSYAGRKVQLRFEYVTDAAVNGEGLLLDDIEIPQLNYKTDFENDDGGWKSEGFVRIQNRLPQTYRVSLIKYGNQTTVETLELDQAQKIRVPLKLGGDVDDVILVVSGTTEFTRQPALYKISIE